MTLPNIMVAPNGARLRKSDHPKLPETVAELVETAAACAEAGADGIHAHVRDSEGAHVLDAGLYSEFLTELSGVLPDFYAQITTEAVGRYSPSEQRQLIWAVQPRAASVALREMSSDGDEDAMRKFYFDCHEAGIEIQHILYSAKDVDKLADLVEAGIVPEDGLTLLHVLGHYDLGRTSAPGDLNLPVLRQLSRALNADWAACAFGPAETACLKRAALAGGKARVGFENNLYHSDGTIAEDNAERVRFLRQALETEVGLH